MGTNYITDPLIFIIDSVLSLYIVAVLLRFLLQWSRAEFYNPVVQFLIKITHPPLKLLRRFIAPIGKIDTSSLLLLLGLQMLSDASILLLKGAPFNLGALTIVSISQLVSLLINVYIFAVFARALLSWLDPSSFRATSSILYSLTEPLLDVCRRVIPNLGGIDLSPLAALMLLQLSKMILLPPLQELANLIS